MEDLSDINFLAVIEGRDYEHSLKKIVSIHLFVCIHVLLRLLYKGTSIFPLILVFLAHRALRSFTSLRWRC